MSFSWQILDTAKFDCFCKRSASVCPSLDQILWLFGLHGDGVPYTKKDSIEIISWDLLFHPSSDRIPITAISKKYVGPNTWRAVMKVIAWSFRMLSLGVVFSRDPDGDEWDCRRRLAAPRICWKCAAALEGPCAYTSTSLAAPWRQERLSDFDFLQSLRGQQIQVSPLLQLPGFRLSYVVLDWLHIVDLGVGVLFLDTRQE